MTNALNLAQVHRPSRPLKIVGVPKNLINQPRCPVRLDPFLQLKQAGGNRIEMLAGLDLKGLQKPGLKVVRIHSFKGVGLKS